MVGTSVLNRFLLHGHWPYVFHQFHPETISWMSARARDSGCMNCNVEAPHQLWEAKMAGIGGKEWEPGKVVINDGVM